MRQRIFHDAPGSIHQSIVAGVEARVTISGASLTRPVSLLMAIMGSTIPSSLKCRRSLIIKSSTTSVREPESMQTRPTLTFPALRALCSSNSSTCAALDQHDLAYRAVHGPCPFPRGASVAGTPVDRNKNTSASPDWMISFNFPDWRGRSRGWEANFRLH